MLKRISFSKICTLLLLMVLLLNFAVITGTTEAATAVPKYVFYFIGDGLGASQRQAAEFFLQEKTGNKKSELLMDTFPVAGINTTYSADTLVTDSAAAGTALATGHKTNNGMISVLPDGKEVKSLIECAVEKGMGTGIITTTRVTHATPAVFAAHNEDRDDENAIAEQHLGFAISSMGTIPRISKRSGYTHSLTCNLSSSSSQVITLCGNPTVKCFSS